jgi:hypothetical protein
MVGRDQLRAPDLSFHIGGPVSADPLCGKRRWIVLFHYECEGLDLADALGTFCPECLQIHHEQRNSQSSHRDRTDYDRHTLLMVRRRQDVLRQ